MGKNIKINNSNITGENIYFGDVYNNTTPKVEKIQKKEDDTAFDRVKLLLENNKIEKALTLLEEIAKAAVYEDQRENLSLLRGQWNRMQEEVMIGGVNREDRGVDNTNFTIQVLGLIKRMKKDAALFGGGS